MITPSEYRTRAAAICQRANQRLSEQPQEGDLAQGVRLAEEVAREAYESLARLVPPTELANLHSEMLVCTRALLDDFPRLVAAADEGMAAVARVSADQMERNQKLGAQVEELWRKLGVPECNR